MTNVRRMMMAAGGVVGETGYGMWMWGNNAGGTLGQGTTVVGGTDEVSSPVQVGGKTWASGSVGDQSSFGIPNTEGSLWAWGENGIGELGLGDVASRSSPVQIGSLTTWSFVQAGQHHTAAIKTDGTLWIWGTNTTGQLGDGTAISRSSPVQVGSLTTWSKVVCGQSMTAAIKTDGTLWSWGSNYRGQLGQGDAGTGKFRSSPVQVGSLTTWASVSAGRTLTSAIKTDGTLWVWGRNYYGEVGDGTRIMRSSPVQLGTATDWSKVSCGLSFALAIKTGGTLWGWGLGRKGALGDGSDHSGGSPGHTQGVSSPIQIGALTNWSTVSAGATNAATSAFKTDGTIWCWGYNNHGQLGDSTGISRSSPVQIGSDTDWLSIIQGGNNGQAIKE
jgi:alpha-tubulin suppressor-like RCC1 family protein